MTEHDDFGMPTPDPNLRHLEFLVGTWQATGTTAEGPFGPGGRTSGEETYEWMEGGFFLVHRWQGTMTMGDPELADCGYEFYDTDPQTGRFRTYFYNNLGPFDVHGSRYDGDLDGDALVMTGPARITRTPNADGTITGESQIPGPDGGYLPFMTTTLTRISWGSSYFDLKK